MAFPLSFVMILGLVGQPGATGSRHDAPAARLDYMKGTLKVHSVHPVSDPKTIYKTLIKKKMVWSLPYREAWTDNTAAYYVWGFSQEP
jgi:hypothetical protein